MLEHNSRGWRTDFTLTKPGEADPNDKPANIRLEYCLLAVLATGVGLAVIHGVQGDRTASPASSNVYSYDGLNVELNQECGEGYEANSDNLGGAGMLWSQPHPLESRTKADCAQICSDRVGCTGFEYAEGASEHGACGTYTAGTANIKGDGSRLSADSNWRSCVKTPTPVLARVDSNGRFEMVSNLPKEATRDAASSPAQTQQVRDPMHEEFSEETGAGLFGSLGPGERELVLTYH